MDQLSRRVNGNEGGGGFIGNLLGLQVPREFYLRMVL